ncbi:MAG: UDP-N-acetylglucosamine 1-carboxyvinyltransferase, partial [Clostridia bacterium]|nr:UDP-N-acetylglucosamine 1-carboxyvinyltransferase [Clostridia bacterium]
MVMAALGNGTSIFVENIFESRYKHAGELNRLGAKIKVEGKVAVVEGVPQLSGAPVSAQELRGGAALAVAGLAAQGETQVLHPEFIDRGYERFEESLRQLGAEIYRI